MRYSAALATSAQAWLARPLAERRNAAGLAELTQVWAAIQGLASAPLCRQCQYSDRVHDLNAYLREYARLTPTSPSMTTEDTTAAPATYQLKPEFAGQTLTADDWNKAVTADNLTDEDAEHFIKRGFGHVFQRIGAALEGVGEQLEGVGDELADDEANDQPTEREQELQDELEAANQKLADQTASYNAAYKQVGDELQAAQANYQNEQQAHATTKANLAQVQQQLSDSQAALALATAPKQKKAAQPATTASSNDNTPASPAPPADSTQGSAPASSDASAAS